MEDENLMVDLIYRKKHPIKSFITKLILKFLNM